MKQVNMLEAKSQLSKLVADIASGRDKEIVIARNGRPSARLVPVQPNPSNQRIGLLKGKYKAPSMEQLNASDEVIARLLTSQA